MSLLAAPASRVPLVLATAQTSNFEFVTLAEDREAATLQLLAAWREHVAEFGHTADPELMSDMLADGEVEFVEVVIGEVLRDGEVLPC